MPLEQLQSKIKQSAFVRETLKLQQAGELL